MATVRIGVGLVLAFDFFCVLRLGLANPIWSTVDQGGFGADTLASAPLLFQFASPAGATLLAFTLALFVAVGLFTRPSAALLLFLSASFASMTPSSDRGIDTALRIALLLLVVSRAGDALSVDSWLGRRLASHTKLPTLGRFFPPPQNRALAWPRRLLVFNLVWIYFTAGLHKTQSAWWPAGDFVALWRVLDDPHFSRVLFPASLYFLTQLGTALTMVFEIGAPIFLLAYLTRGRPQNGPLLRALERIRFVEVWVATGVIFHLGLLFTIRLGIFPLGMLSLYAAFFPLSPPPTKRTGDSTKVVDTPAEHFDKASQ